MSDKEAAAYKRGYTCGFVEARIEVFGAIRRAAEVARAADRTAEELWNEIDDPWEDSGAFEVESFAKGCRAAIRAAIGSDKT